MPADKLLTFPSIQSFEGKHSQRFVIAIIDTPILSTTLSQLIYQENSTYTPLLFGITSRICIIRSLSLSIWEYKEILNSKRVANFTCNSFQNMKVNPVSRSDIIKTCTLYNCIISFKHNLANFFTGPVALTSKNRLT